MNTELRKKLINFLEQKQEEETYDTTVEEIYRKAFLFWEYTLEEVQEGINQMIKDGIVSDDYILDMTIFKEEE